MKVTSQRIRYIVMDFLMANVAIFLFNIVRFYVLEDENVGYLELSTFLVSKAIVVEQIVLPFMMLAVNAVSGYYNRPLLKSRIHEFVTTFSTALVQTVLLYFALLTNQQTSVRLTNYELLIYMFLLLWVITYVGRYIVTSFSLHRFRRGKWRYSVIVAGVEDAAAAMAADIESKRRITGMSLAGIVKLHIAEGCVDIDTSVLLQLKETGEAQEIMLITTGLAEKQILQVLYKIIPLGMPVKISTDSLSMLTSNIRLQSIYEEPYIDVSTANVSDATKNIKRCFDVLVSATALLFLCVPMAVIALIVSRTSPGGAFFSQERIGLRQKPFKIYKFRTMSADAEASGPRLSSPDDARVTPIGRWLRKYRIDELPQFWNVLKGDMSIVGPRPERAYFINMIMREAPYYSLVQQVRPGITSWGMVKYGYASNVAQMVERLRYDLVYLANISITNDLKIIIYTVKTVFKGRGM